MHLRFHGRIWAVLLIVAASLGGVSSRLPRAVAQSAPVAGTGFVDKVFRDDNGEHRYTVFVPHGYRVGTPTPTIVFLHGAGERGTDGKRPLTFSIAPFIKAREATFPFLVVFPQVENLKGPIKSSWFSTTNDGQRMRAILAAVERDYSVDAKRTSLVGWSMGGYGAWEQAAATPDKWSAVVALSAGADPKLVPALKGVPAWAFHGARDAVVRPSESREIVAALREAGARVKYTEYPEGDHLVFTQAFNDERLYRWLLDPTTDVGDTPLSPMPTNPGIEVARSPWNEFTPVLDVPNAVSVRVGNDLLRDLADELPGVLESSSFSGSLPDVTESTKVFIFPFHVRMSGLCYSAQLVSADIRALGADRLHVSLALANGQVTISRTTIVGTGFKSADVGPIGIYLARQAPVHLTFELTPTLIGKRIELSASNACFAIPPHDFYVSEPDCVSTTGLLMNPDRVARSLVDGLYEGRGRIEDQVLDNLPQIVDQLESRLNDYVGHGDELASAIWPLPVYQPQLKLWPSDLAIDSNGLTVCFGFTASSINPDKAMQWVVVPPLFPGAESVPTLPGLSVGIAPQAVKPLTQLMIASDVSRIHVDDTPTKSFPLFVNRERMTEVFPDLARLGEQAQLWAELVIVEPMSVARGHSPEEKNPVGLEIEVPKLRIEMAVKPTVEAKEWEPFANIDVTIRQDVEPRLVAPKYDVREFLLSWAKPAKFDVDVCYADSWKPENPAINKAVASDLFAAGWSEFTRGGEEGGKRLDDMKVGGVTLRAAQVTWAEPLVLARFAAPGLRLTNRTTAPVKYQARAAGSDWSQPWSLAPGESHDYPVPYAIDVRQVEPAGTGVLRVPTGGEFEFRPLDGAVRLDRATPASPVK